MGLHLSLDTVAIISRGVYTETYGSSNKSRIANLYASLGYLEDAPGGTAVGGFSKFLIGFSSKFRRGRGRRGR